MPIQRKRRARLIETYREIDIDSVLADVSAQWDELLDTVQVTTPDRAMDIMLNDWLLYQVAVCRLWARTAYYQSSGAFGFRDQLQDVTALCVGRPDLARRTCAARGRQAVRRGRRAALVAAAEGAGHPHENPRRPHLAAST